MNKCNWMNLVSVFAVSTSLALAQTFTWRKLADVTPSYTDVFGYSGMAFDSQRNRAVLLSGIGNGGSCWGGLETWEFDGQGWGLRIPPAAPSCRGFFSYAYDPQRSYGVLFGGHSGHNGAVLGDTWTWNGTVWTTRFPVVAPHARSYHAMTYNAVRGKVVLFGGADASYNMLNDIWEWDGANWAQVPALNPPPGRAWHGLAFDQSRGKLVTFGGFTVAGGNFNDETWEFDGQAWTMLLPSVRPSPRAAYSLSYNPVSAKVVLFGGYFNQTNEMYNDTWEWDGATWSQLALPTNPSQRVGASMCFFPPSGKMLMVGGRSNSVYSPLGVGSDVWTLGMEPGAVPGTVSTFGIGCGNPVLAFAPMTNSRPVLGQTFVSRIDQARNGIAFVAIGLNSNFAGPFLLPFDLGGFGFYGCTLLQDCGLQFAGSCTSIDGVSARHDLAIVNIAAMLRLPFYMQAWSLDPAANPGGLVVSNGLQLMVGDI